MRSFTSKVLNGEANLMKINKRKRNISIVALCLIVFFVLLSLSIALNKGGEIQAPGKPGNETTFLYDVTTVSSVYAHEMI